MKIDSITPKYIQNLKQLKTDIPQDLPNSQIENNYDNVDYSKIAFGAIYNVKPKAVNIEAEKNKLIRQISELIQSQVQECDWDDLIVTAMRRAFGFVRNKLRRQAEILQEIENLLKDNISSPQELINRKNQLMKEWKMLEKQKPEKPKPGGPLPEEKYDFPLLNKFKSALAEDDFNLARVYRAHYSGLNEIKTVEELQERYPKIKIPPRPEAVISKKIAESLTRDFYEGFFELTEKNETPEKIFLYSDKKLREILNAMGEKFQVDGDVLYQRLADYAHRAILDSIVKVNEKGVSFVPEVRKIKEPKVTDMDIDLLCLNFDDFVLSTVRKHYLDGEKINGIKYQNEYVTIPLARLSNTEYKFEKMPEKIRGMIASGDKLHRAQRDYGNFDADGLKNRLGFYLNADLANDDRVLNHIISFDSCNFAQGDIEPMIKFLREMDAVLDGTKTCDDALSIIAKEDIRPRGTDRLNELEHQKALARLKLEQQKAFELTTLKNEFDDVVNSLYANNMNGTAIACSKYRPEQLEDRSVEDAKFIIRLIKDAIGQNGSKIVDKSRLEASITRWDTFNSYKNTDPENPVFKKAVSMFTDEKGVLDIDKAGRYIVNSEIVENYPMSADFVKDKGILELIMSRTGSNKDEAVKYLCKFDDFNDLPSDKKTKISEFVDLFDLKDTTEKVILKYILENHYARVNTSVMIKPNEGSEAVPATIGSSVKADIMDKYKFPTCLEYLKGFEEALSSFANDRGSSGIKRVGQNNKNFAYRYELKLAGHDDRLFSTKSDYLFDVFSDKGLH